MKVLALTHAHLSPDGLSPVSCERADSLVGTWGGRLNWEVDVVHTKNTKWRGIWPDGKGLKINILTEEAPQALMTGVPQLFANELQTKLANKQFLGVVSLATKRITKRIRNVFAGKGLVLPHQVALAEKWGKYLSALKSINSRKYDFIFVCAGYGDEYLLQTALVLSDKFHIPMVVDFRDLWSEHHDPARLTEKQKEQVRGIEKKLLVNTIMVSAPQTHMIHLLKRWVTCPVYHLPHSAYIDKSWEDGVAVSYEFRMLYAGKLYANGAGLKMLLALIKKLSGAQLYKPFKCYFFVDDTATLEQLAVANGVSGYVSVHGWVSPSEL